jgi:hypothetical protein
MPIQIIRDHHPLKQGLRPGNHLIGEQPNYQRPSSIKTRIKTLQEHRQSYPRTVIRDHHPLKQGLRLLGLIQSTTV